MAETTPNPPTEDYAAIAAREKQGREAAEAQAAQYRDQYARDMNAIQSALIQAAQQAQQQVQPAHPVEEDDTWAIDPKKLAAKVEQVAAEKAQRIAQEAIAPARNVYLRERITSNHRDCKARLEHFGRYEQEILQLMNAWGQQQGPEVAAAYENWSSAYDIVISRHAQELIREEAKKLAARRATDDDADEEEETPIEERSPPRSPASPPTPPVSVAHPRSPMRSTQGKPRIRLTPAQQVAAEVSHMSPEEYAQWADPNYDPDPLNLGGKR
jgi:hypothetical protein